MIFRKNTKNRMLYSHIRVIIVKNTQKSKENQIKSAVFKFFLLFLHSFTANSS